MIYLYARLRAVRKMYCSSWMDLLLRSIYERVTATLAMRVVGCGKLDGDADVGKSDQRYQCMMEV